MILAISRYSQRFPDLFVIEIFYLTNGFFLVKYAIKALIQKSQKKIKEYYRKEEGLYGTFAGTGKGCERGEELH